MKAIHFSELIPDKGYIAVSGGRLEDDFIKAICYAVSDGKDVKFVPSTPHQIALALDFGIPHTSGPPTHFFLQAEGDFNDCLLESNTSSVLADRVMCKTAENVWAFVVDTEKKILVEAVSSFVDNTLDELSLYGEVDVMKMKNHLGHVLVVLTPFDDDFFTLQHFLRDIPGVVDVGIYPLPPDRKIRLF